MNIILPKESHNRRLDFVVLQHPRTQEPAQFLVDNDTDAVNPLLELTSVGADSRSALVGDQVIKDATLAVATPLHPLFTIIPTLAAHKQRALPLDFLLSLSATDNTHSLDESLIAPYLPSITDFSSDLYQLSEEKLKQWLDTRVQRLRAGLPPTIRQEVVNTILPADPHETVAEDLVDAAETYAAASMLATSWLDPQSSEWYLNTCDFSALEHAIRSAEASQLAYERTAAPLEPEKRSNDSKNTPVAKRAKTLPKAANNRSILDMFRAKRN